MVWSGGTPYNQDRKLILRELKFIEKIVGKRLSDHSFSFEKLSYDKERRLLNTPNGIKDFSTTRTAQGLLIAIFEDQVDPSENNPNSVFLKKHRITLGKHGVFTGTDLSSAKQTIKLRTGLEDIFSKNRYMGINSKYL